MCPVVFARLYCCIPLYFQALSIRSLVTVSLSCFVDFRSLLPVPSPFSVFMSWTQLWLPAQPRPQLCLTSLYFSPVIPVTDPRLPHGPASGSSWTFLFAGSRPWAFVLFSRFPIKPLLSSWTWSGDWFSVQQSWQFSLFFISCLYQMLWWLNVSWSVWFFGAEFWEKKF